MNGLCNTSNKNIAKSEILLNVKTPYSSVFHQKYRQSNNERGHLNPPHAQKYGKPYFLLFISPKQGQFLAQP